MKIFLLTIICLLLISATAYTQAIESKVVKKQDSQNLQNKINILSSLKRDINSLEDAPARCILRFEIAKFIFKSKSDSNINTAKSFVIDSLEDFQKNSEQFSESEKNYRQNQFLSLVKIYLSDSSAQIEKKYFAENANVALSRYQQLDMGRDAEKIVIEVENELRKGIKPKSLIILLTQLSEKSPELSMRLIGSFVSFAERTDDTTVVEDLFYMSRFFLDNSMLRDLQQRVLTASVNWGQKAVYSQTEGSWKESARSNLVYLLPRIEKLLPNSYPQAAVILNALNRQTSKSVLDREEIYERIRQSRDKLQQTINEADSAKDADLKQSLYSDAARLALRQEKFRLAVDLVLKIENKDKNFVSWRDNFLADDILSKSLKKKDVESAQYLSKNILDLNSRGESVLKIAEYYSKEKDSYSAFQSLRDALKIIEKAENSIDKVRTMFLAVPIALKIDRQEAFDITRSAIKIVNRLPAPNVEDKIGTEKRNKYVLDVLGYVLYDVFRAFGKLAKEAPNLTNQLPGELDSKALKLAAEIAVEINKPDVDAALQTKENGQK